MVNTKGKYAFITGASRGIGRGIALFMAQQGCNVILHSRKLENTKAVAEEIKKLGVEVYCFAAELSDDDSVRHMLKEIDALNVVVDFVFNNAGVQVAYRNNFYETPAKDFVDSFNINLIAPTTICYHFLPKMIKRGFGRVINTTSGIMNEPEQAGYSASKAALDKYTTDIASSLQGTDVMISLTDPGWCRTDLGGPGAPNDVTSTIPGVVLPAFLTDKISGRTFSAQSYAKMTLEEALQSLNN